MCGVERWLNAAIVYIKYSKESMLVSLSYSVNCDEKNRCWPCSHG